MRGGAWWRIYSIWSTNHMGDPLIQRFVTELMINQSIHLISFSCWSNATFTGFHVSHDHAVSVVFPSLLSCCSGWLTEKVLLGLGVGGDGLSGDLDWDPLERTETKSRCLIFCILKSLLIQMFSELNLVRNLAGSQMESGQVVSVEGAFLT